MTRRLYCTRCAARFRPINADEPDVCAHCESPNIPPVWPSDDDEGDSPTTHEE